MMAEVHITKHVGVRFPVAIYMTRAEAEDTLRALQLAAGKKIEADFPLGVLPQMAEVAGRLTTLFELAFGRGFTNDA